MTSKGETRAFEAIAGVLCERHFTDGFCNGRDRPECQCNKLAQTALAAIKSRGVELVWPASPTQQDRRDAKMVHSIDVAKAALSPKED